MSVPRLVAVISGALYGAPGCPGNSESRVLPVGPELATPGAPGLGSAQTTSDRQQRRALEADPLLSSPEAKRTMLPIRVGPRNQCVK